VRLYHVTSHEAAERIVRNGFRDGEIGRHWAPVEHGVWVADRPFDTASMGQVKSQALLALEVPEDAVAEYEIVEYDEETGERLDKAYREWIVPADVLNRWPVERAKDV
jgi:hypothetical protein